MLYYNYTINIDIFSSTSKVRDKLKPIIIIIILIIILSSIYFSPLELIKVQEAFFINLSFRFKVKCLYLPIIVKSCYS